MQDRHTMRIAIALAVALLLLAAGTYLFARSEIDADFQEETASTASILAAQLDLGIRSGIADLETMAQLMEPHLVDRPALDLLITGAENSSRTFNMFMVLDDAGTVVARPSKPERVGVDRSSREYFVAVMERSATYVGDVYVTTSGDYSLAVAAPVQDETGSTKGVLVGGLRLADRNPRAYELVLEPPVAEAWQVYVVSNDGLLLAHSDVDIAGANLEQLVMDDPVFEAASRGDWASRVVEDDGRTWHASPAPVSTTGWTLVVRAPTSVTEETTQRVLESVVPALVLLYITLLAGYIAYGRRTGARD